MIRSLLLPRTDAGVAVQVVATVILAPVLVITLVRWGRTDAAWLAGGVVALWTAVMALRVLH